MRTCYFSTTIFCCSSRISYICIMKNTCKHCGNPTNNVKFCSRSCSASSTNVTSPKTRTKKTCIVCGKQVKSYRHSRCEEHQQEYLDNKPERIRELTLATYWNKKSLEKLHQSSKNAHIRLLARSHFKDLVTKPCYICGYSKHVELCHIKPIREFKPEDKVGDVNSYKNLIQLCPNCHWEFDNGLVELHPRRDSNSH